MALLSILLIGVGSVAVSWVVTRYLVSRRWGRCLNNFNVRDKVVVVTGGNSGIGFETAKCLARLGASVIIAARNDKKSAEAVELIAKDNCFNENFAGIDWMHLDLNSFSSIHEFAHQLKLKYSYINILIHNAGVYDPPYQINEDGLEMQMAVNHVGNALLTQLLIRHIEFRASEKYPNKLIFVNSALYKRGNVEESYFKSMSELQYKKTNMYANSKLCSLLYARRLAAEFQSKKLPITVNIVSPGIVYTNLARYQSFMFLKYVLFFIPMGPFVRTARQGAQTVLQCAMNSNLTASGRYFSNCQPTPFASVANRKDWQEQVWEWTNKLIDRK